MNLRPTERAYLLVLCLIVILACSSIRNVLPSFDGAMNLLPAKNLAVHGKYYSYYYEEPFPSSIQTRFTLQIPAALFIYFFGVNNSSILLASALYTVGFFILFVLLSTALSFDQPDRRINFFAGPLLLTLPFFLTVGLRGWGEVITYFFVFSSLLLWIQLIENKAKSAGHYLLFGMLIGLAVVTKWVALITLPAFVGALILTRLNSRFRLSRYVWSIWGFLAAILLYEAFRFVNHGPLNYSPLFQQQFSSLLRQSGAIRTEASADPASESMVKPLRHLLETANTLQISPWILVPHFVIPPAILAYLRSKLEWRRSTRVILIFLLLLIFGYLCWWTMIVPTPKIIGAKFRMLLPAFIANALVISLVLQYAATSLFKRVPIPKWVLLLCAASLATSSSISYANRDSLMQFFAASKIDPMISGELIRTINNLPANAEVYGHGYWQNPQLALFAKKPFKNLLNTSLSEVLDKEQQYLLRAPYPKVFTEILQVVEHDTVVKQKHVGRLFQITGAREEFDVSDPSSLQDCLTEKRQIAQYENKFGIFSNSNWTTHRFAFLLAPGSYSKLSIEYYFRPKLQFYIDPLIANISINGIYLGEFSVKKNLQRVAFEIDENATRLNDTNQIVVSLNGGPKYPKEKLYGIVVTEVCLSK